MHERAAVTEALARMMDDSGGSIARVVAAVGPGVDSDVVAGIWEEVVAGTPASEAELVCKPAFDLLRCLGCGSDFPGSKLDSCPECSGDGLVIRRAPEFEVRTWVGAV